VNVLIGLEILKAGFGWSDEELYDSFCFNTQVRYALGYQGLREGHFALRTLYNFRRRILRHFCRTGVCLLEQAFEQVTDAQARALGLDTSALRVDSTQVASNIRNFSRLHLLVEVLHRVYRMLCEADKAEQAKSLEDYIRYRSDQFVYGVSSQEGRAHIDRIGPLMAQLVEALAATYGHEPDYEMLQRVLNEQYVQEGDKWRRREPRELPSGCLCAPDDPEATMRRKGSQVHKGYVSNIAETCAPDNPVQLIVKTRTAPNLTSDTKLLRQDLFSLKDRFGVNTFYTDGGFNNEEMYHLMRALGIQHWQTGIQGRPSSRYLELWRYRILRSLDGQPMKVICPNSQEAQVIEGRKPEHYRACYALNACEGCPYADRCLARAYKSHRTLSFSDYTAEIAKRRERIEEFKATGHNPRAAVESTVYSVKRPFGEKLPVRGRLRIHHLITCSAWMTNVRRISRYWRRLLRSTQGSFQALPVLSFLRQTWGAFRQVVEQLGPQRGISILAPRAC
jgi:hypothetical protein